MAPISNYSRRRKLSYFIDRIPKDAHVLEIGCGDKWVGRYMNSNGWKNYTGIDLFPPADIVGDIKNWKALGLRAQSFDFIIAFELVEHVDVFNEITSLLKDEGQVFLTTPIPHRDWVLKILEALKLNQKRTSPHSNLLYLCDVKQLEPIELKKIAGLAQWGTFRKRNL